MEELLFCATAVERDTAVVTVIGECDLSNPNVLDGALADALSRGTPRVDVDLAGLTFGGSTLIRCLIDAESVASRRGVRLVVRHVHQNVAKVFEVCDTDHVLEYDEVA